jgi:hypothetical protein
VRKLDALPNGNPLVTPNKAKTIETHRAQLMERLDIRDVPGLVRYAIRTGIATPDK